MVKQNVAPWPSPSDSTHIRPPCHSTIRLTNVKPTLRPFGFGIDLLEETEDSFMISWVNADSVVTNITDQLVAAMPGADLNPWVGLISQIFDGIVDKIREPLRRGDTDLRKRVPFSGWNST